MNDVVAPVETGKKPLKASDFKSAYKPVWCPGCGDYSVLGSVTKALAMAGRPPEEVAVISGIGCSSRIPAYTSCYGFHGVHGRALAVATGLKVARPELLVVVDPVMGDRDSGLYVHAGLPQAMPALARLATGLTPNAFELERLVGRPVTTVSETVAAAGELLGGRTRWVVVTSAAPAAAPPGETMVVMVTADSHQVVTHEVVASAAKGTGDLFSAVLVHGLLAGTDLAAAVGAAHERVAAVLERTSRLGCAELVLS